MRRRWWWILLVTLWCVAGWAQSNAKAEVFGGYQYSNLSDSIATKRLSSNGWNAGFAYYFSRCVGLKADLGGAYATDNTSGYQPFGVRNYTYTFGPVFSARKDKRLTPFGEALFGGYHGKYLWICLLNELLRNVGRRRPRREGCSAGLCACGASRLALHTPTERGSVSQGKQCANRRWGGISVLDCFETRAEPQSRSVGEISPFHPPARDTQ